MAANRPPYLLFALLAISAIAVGAALLPWPIGGAEQVADLSAGGFTRIQRLRVPLTAPYEIDLNVDRRLGVGPTECLFTGKTGLSGTPCTGPKALSLQWRLLRDGRLVSEGLDGQCCAYGTDISLILGAETLRGGEDYALEVRSLSDGGDLKRANPRLVVELAPETVENAVAMRALLLFGGAAGLLVGLAWLAVFRRRPSPTKNPSGHP